MNDEQLQAFDVSAGRETGPAITYNVLRRIELSKTAGFCIADNAPQGQRRFAYESMTYALQIAFRQNGENVRLFMLCDRASSGLPALYNCDREVKTLDWSAGNPVNDTNNGPDDRSNSQGNDQAATPRWMFGGSQIRIAAQGNARRILYVNPNAAARQSGVSPGDVLFEGERQGDRYVGTFHQSTDRCGVVTYEVNGYVKNNERQVVVSGLRPIKNRNCRNVDRREVRHVFERR